MVNHYVAGWNTNAGQRVSLGRHRGSRGRVAVCSITRVTAAIAAFLLALGSALAEAPPDYLLGPGDVVKITVFQSPDLTTETRVGETGAITFPLLGPLSVVGQSTASLERMLAQRLRDGRFVNDPQINVIVTQFRSMQVSVLGQVSRPGKYALEQSRNRLTEVLAVAGGVTALGGDTVTLITSEQGKERKVEIDLPALMHSGDKTKDVLLKNGDVIFVPKYPVFYIYGEVQRPGQYRLERDMTVMQALAVGGGLTTRGTQRGMQISRRDGASRIVAREVKPMEAVLADDVIVVKESLF